MKMKCMIVSPRRIKFVLATLFAGLLVVTAEAQSDQTISVPNDGPAAAQGAQTSAEPSIPTEEPVMARVEAEVVRPARRVHQIPEKVEINQSELNQVKTAAVETTLSAKPQIEQKTSGNLANLLLLKKALKRSASGKWYDGKDGAGRKASKEASTLTILGAVLSGLGIILLFVIPILGILFVLGGNIMLFIEALK